MLGSLRSKGSWTWGVFGKHPAARDFIRLGSDFPIFTAFYDWVERGYQMMEHGGNQQLHSWRFWARGMKKSHIVCGLVRDSHDDIKRSYPCLIIGTGPLKGWENNWSELPMVLEVLWGRLEYLFVKKFNSAGELTGEINSLQRLSVNFSDNETLKDHEQDGYRNNRVKTNPKAHTGDVLSHSLNNDNPSESAVRWLRGVSSRVSSVPNAVFLGGTPESSFLVLFTRSLMPADFTNLWSEYYREEIKDGYVVTGK
jgi:type VI secretion system protein VasJ